jgi:hypothetical protein
MQNRNKLGNPWDPAWSAKSLYRSNQGRKHIHIDENIQNAFYLAENERFRSYNEKSFVES